MSLTVILLVTASAITHASWNAILKRCRDPENAVVSMMSIAALCGVVFAILRRIPAPPSTSTAWCMLTGVLEAGYFLTLARALTRAPLGSVYTVVRGGALVVVWPVSVLLLGETITVLRAGGTFLVALGLAATGAVGRPPTGAVGDTKVGATKKASGLTIAMLCALLVGGYQLAYKLALSTGGQPEAVVAISLSTAVLLNVATLGRRRALVLRAFRAEPVQVVIGGLLASVSFLVFLSAMKSEGAGVVVTLRNTSILFAQGLAIMLGERPRRLGVVGAILVTGGALLLAC